MYVCVIVVFVPKHASVDDTNAGLTVTVPQSSAPVALANQVANAAAMHFSNTLVHVHGCYLYIKGSPLKCRTPQHFMTAYFGYLRIKILAKTLNHQSPCG